MKLPVASFRNPGSRRLALMVSSGILIAVAFLFSRLRPTAAFSGYVMLAAALAAGQDIAARAWAALRARVIGIEFLVSIAALGAIVLGEYWEAAAVGFLFLFGAYLEARTLRRTRRVLGSLLDLAPLTATVLRDGEEERKRPDELRIGEQILVRPGEVIAVDGLVVAGSSAVNESLITGEPLPADKTEGDPVYAGTINRDGLLRVRATRVGKDSTLERIIHRVEEAQDERAPTQAFIERFARWYTPAIVAASVLLFILTRKVELSLTLLVISCPGALVISTPVAIVAGIGRAARAGILIKGGEYLERAGAIDTIALDKTGTLTKAEPRLAALRSFGELPALPGFPAETAEERLILWAAIAERGSEHPLAAALIKAGTELLDAKTRPAWGERARHLPAPERFEAHPGKGLVADYAGRRVAVGSPRFFETLGIALGPEEAAAAEELKEGGGTLLLLALDGQPRGVFSLVDSLREEARGAMEALRAAGIGRIVMLTGDRAESAAWVGRAVGITEIHAGLLPEQKLEAIKAMKGKGRVVAMVGDGINDAPALAAADVSIAMAAAGSGVAIETADIALMNDDLGKIALAVSLSRKTLGVIRQNLAIALVTVAVLIAGVLAGEVNMAGGMLLHEASVLVVILNAMRLLGGPAKGRMRGWVGLVGRGRESLAL